MDIFIEDVELLRDLFRSENGVTIYSLHKKYMMSPGQVSRSVRKFLEINVIKLKGKKIFLTEEGHNWILIHKNKLFLESPKYWKESFLDENEVNKKKYEPYMPSLKVLNKRHFTENLSGDDLLYGAKH